MEYIKIGNVKIAKTAALAPMADVADTAFRVMAKRFGAAFTVGEMTSAKGLIYGDKKTADLLRLSCEERPAAVQLFGSEPDIMAEAVRIALDYEPDVIDINAGCPVNKVVGTGSGSALMKDPKRFGELIGAAVKSAEIKTVPVTVKIRAGWDSNSINAVEIAKIAESEGVSAVAVHGRTRIQMYSGKADWSVIESVKKAVSITVIGNGDVDSAESCSQMYGQTGCDLVMIGRAACGRPWIFCEIEGGSVPNTLEKRLEIMKEHAELAVSIKGEYRAMREFRKHAAWYIKGIRNAAALRNKCMSLDSIEHLYNLIEQINEKDF